MAGAISVTPAELKKTASTIEAKAQECEGLYKKLTTEVDSLGSNWTGDANKEYARQIKDFESKFKDMKSVLGQYKEFLLKAAEIYQGTEDSIKQAAAKLNR